MQKRPKGKPQFRPRIKQREHNINEDITAPEVRLVRDGVEPAVFKLADALAMAREIEAI